MLKGFKVFNSDWTCRGFQYEVGKIYEMDEMPIVCGRGFHFCEKAADCFGYYSFDPNNKVAEVIAHGQCSIDGNKTSTNKIEIVREIPWPELLEIVNTGKGNSGLNNTGDWNTGDRNTGHWNTGDRNTGDWNTGHRNTGDWNTSDFNTGCFCTEEHKIKFFDSETDMTLSEWRRSDAYWLMRRIDDMPARWIWADSMSDQEKKDHPSYETTGGYLKKCDASKAYIEWWDILSGDEKKTIKEIPNFDAKKFELITGIDVSK